METKLLSSEDDTTDNHVRDDVKHSTAVGFFNAVQKDV